jgi:hypothetical protein
VTLVVLISTINQNGSATLSFVIPSVPGFPASGTGERNVCGFL